MSRVITERVEITDKMLKPSKRLIDADALLNIFSRYYGNDKIEVDEVIEWIEEQPTIEERKKGKWIPLGVRHGWVCSNCKKEDAYAFSLNEKCDYEMQDFFCPNCGADMRGEQDE